MNLYCFSILRFRLLVLMALVVSGEPLFAGECRADFVDVYPKAGDISGNSIFVISYLDHIFKLRQVMPQITFELQTSHGVVPLRVIDTVYGGQYGQIVLRPTRTLRHGDYATLEVRSQGRQLYPFCSAANAYHVARKKDKIPPHWLPDTMATSTDFSNMASSYPGFILRVRIPAMDSIKGDTLPAVLYKVRIGNETFYYHSTKMMIENWSGFCDYDIPLTTNHSYDAQVTLLDVSGNVCKEIRNITFTVPGYKPNIYIKNDDGTTREE